MKKLSLLFIILSFSVFGFSQTPRRSRTARPAKANAVSPQPTPSPADPAAEKASLDDALAAATPAEKIEKIGGFLKAYPASAERNRALESLTGARAARADEELAAGETAAAVELFRVALAEAPKPYSDRFFAEVVSRIPANLYWRGLREEGLQAARSIETNVSSNVNQILVLANFYASIENGDDAKRLADAAIKLNASSAGAYTVSGHANLEARISSSQQQTCPASERVHRYLG
jgi:tetratricopeptide (TPR) repeat protein